MLGLALAIVCVLLAGAVALAAVYRWEAHELYRLAIQASDGWREANEECARLAAALAPRQQHVPPTSEASK